MHCVRLADLAATLANHAAVLTGDADAIPASCFQAYWIANRARFNLWHRVLGRYREAIRDGDPDHRRQWWDRHFGVLEEVVVSEVLTRVVATLAEELDRRGGIAEYAPVADGVLKTHLDVSNRIAKILLSDRTHDVSHLVRLNRLRGSTSHWTDHLIGRMTVHGGSRRYGIDPDRVAAVAADVRDEPPVSRRLAILLTASSMHRSLAEKTHTEPSLPSANRGVSDAVVCLLRPDMFDSLGVMRGLWMHRLQLGTTMAGSLLDDVTGKQTDAPEHIGGLEYFDEDGGPWAEAAETFYHPVFERWFGNSAGS